MASALTQFSLLWPLLAMVAGASIAIQAGINSQLGVLLNNAAMATIVAFTVAAMVTLCVIVCLGAVSVPWAALKAVPLYMWFSGGLLSAFGVGVFYHLIPKMGVGTMMSFALSGQMVAATLVSHWRWFDLPHNPLNSVKLVGMVLLIAGVFLMNWESAHDS